MNAFKKLNSMLTKEDVVNILSHFGFPAHPKRNFRLRPDDRDPSASLFVNNKTGFVMVKDFGDNFTGDVFSTLKEYAGVPYKESLEFVKNYLNLGKLDNDIMNKYDVRTFNIRESNKDKLSTEEIEERWQKLYPLKSLPKKKFQEEISKLIRFDFFVSANDLYKNEFLENVRYSSFLDDVAVRANRPDGKILSYKYRRYRTKDGEIIKWKAIKGTEANKYSQIVIRDPNEPVFIIEGYHDYINALLAGINFIAIPFKYYKDFKKEELNLFRGKKYDFILVQDYDFDEEDEEKLRKKILDSKKQKEYINKTLAAFSRTGRIFVWGNIRKIALHMEIDNPNKVKDFSDLLNNSKFVNIGQFKNRLLEISYMTVSKFSGIKKTKSFNGISVK